MCTDFKVKWMEQLISRRIEEMTDFENLASRLKALQLADELKISELKMKLLESLKSEVFLLVMKDAEYQYLKFATRYLLAKWRILTLRKAVESAFFVELTRIFSEFDKILLNEPDYIGDNLLHNAHSQDR